MINIKYTPSLIDFTAVNLLISRQIPRLYKQAVMQLYIMRFVLIFFIVIQVFLYTRDYGWHRIIICSIAVGIIFIYPYFNLWIYKQTLKKRYKRMVSQTPDLSVSLSIDNEYVTLMDSKSEHKFKADSIMRVIEVGSYFFIQLDTEKYLMIPKNQVDSPSLMQNLSGWALSKHIPYITKLNWDSNIYKENSKI